MNAPYAAARDDDVPGDDVPRRRRRPTLPCPTPPHADAAARRCAAMRKLLSP
jgi:hypothetical protein